MPQPPQQMIVPDACFHIYNSGADGGDVFLEENDYKWFFYLLRQLVRPVAHVLSYALLRDHYHLTVLMKPATESPASLPHDPARLDFLIKRLQYGYSGKFNPELTELRGIPGVFEPSFRRERIDSLDQLQQLIRYHHHNPEIHKEVDDFRSHYYTSYYDYTVSSGYHTASCGLGLSRFGGEDAFTAAHEGPLMLVREDWEP